MNYFVSIMYCDKDAKFDFNLGVRIKDFRANSGRELVCFGSSQSSSSS
jgi:hypothetical protein